MYKNWRSDNESSQAEREAMKEVEQILKRYDEETKKIVNDYETIVSILQYEIIFELRDIIVELKYKKIETLTVKRHSTQGRILCGTENTDGTKSGVLSSTLKTSSLLAPAPVKITQLTTKTCCITTKVSVCTEIFNSAKSLNEVSRLGGQPLKYAVSGGSLALANQANQMIKTPNVIQSLSHVAESTSSLGAISKFASYKNGQKLVETNVKVYRASKATKSVTKHVLNSNKVVRVTANAQKTKSVKDVTKTVTENAKYSKVGLAIGVISIPIDIYYLKCAQDDLKNTPEAVKRTRQIADDLEKEDFTATIEAFEEMHIEVCKVYEREKTEKLNEFLNICHRELGLNFN
ncbi:hypothetical protein ACF0H5_002426 [Mactra antiquata]